MVALVSKSPKGCLAKPHRTAVSIPEHLPPPGSVPSTWSLVHWTQETHNFLRGRPHHLHFTDFVTGQRSEAIHPRSHSWKGQNQGSHPAAAHGKVCPWPLVAASLSTAGAACRTDTFFWWSIVVPYNPSCNQPTYYIILQMGQCFLQENNLISQVWH